MTNNGTDPEREARAAGAIGDERNGRNANRAGVGEQQAPAPRDSSGDRPATEPGGCECQKCGRIFIGAEWHTECAVCAAPAAEEAFSVLADVEKAMKFFDKPQAIVGTAGYHFGRALTAEVRRLRSAAPAIPEGLHQQVRAWVQWLNDDKRVEYSGCRIVAGILTELVALASSPAQPGVPSEKQERP